MRNQLFTLIRASVLVALVAVSWACRTTAPLAVETARKTPYPILFVHGLGGTAAGWESTGMIDLLLSFGFSYGGEISASGDDVLVLNARGIPPADCYTVQISDSFQDLNLWAAELTSIVEAVTNETDADKVILVAHSAGGVAARKYLVDHLDDHRVWRLVTLGSPHLGSDLASMSGLFGITRSDSRLSVLRPVLDNLADAVGIPLTSDALLQLQPEGSNPWLTRLNASPHPTDVHYTSLVVELGSEQPVLHDLRELFQTARRNPSENPAISRQLNRLLGLLGTSPSDAGDGVVLARNQKMSNVSWFRESGTPVEETTLRASSHSEARRRSTAILAAIAGEPEIVAVHKRKRRFSKRLFLEVDMAHELSGMLTVEAVTPALPHVALHPGLSPSNVKTPNGIVRRLTLGPLLPREANQLDLDISWPTASELFVTSLVRREAVFHPPILPDTSDAHVRVRLISVSGVPDSDQRLFGIGKGADVVVSFSSGGKRLAETREITDITDGSAVWDKAFDFQLNPLSDDLHIEVWDIDPLGREFLGDARWEPGEWPHRSFLETTSTGIVLAIGAAWTPVPLMKAVATPFRW